MEHRWGRRRSTDVRVQFRSMPSTTGMGQVLNISVTGAFMATRVPLRVLSLVHLVPDGRGLDLHATDCLVAYVVRRDATGVGLEWCQGADVQPSIDQRLAALRGETPDLIARPAQSSHGRAGGRSL